MIKIYRRYILLLCSLPFTQILACSTSPPIDISDIETFEIAQRISNGMQRLGASQARGDCYARRITDSLVYDEAHKAALIVEKANSKDEMRESILNAQQPISQAFIKAHFGCSLAG